jgi:uncharacterized protein YdiU (UPF0061 family)
VSFIHGVMNTDNMTSSGETIDYGLCAFMDAVDPGTVLSSIDHGGRCAYGNQPAMAGWNLARFAETLVPLLGAHQDTPVAAATELVGSFPGPTKRTGAWECASSSSWWAEPRPDPSSMTCSCCSATSASTSPARCALRREGYLARSSIAGCDHYDRWLRRWQVPLARQARTRSPTTLTPATRVEETLAVAACGGDLVAFSDLLHIVRDPFYARPDHDRYAAPASNMFGPNQAVCGT